MDILSDFPRGLDSDTHATVEHLISSIQEAIAARGFDAFVDALLDPERAGQVLSNGGRPRYFVPVHGEYRHLVRHAALAAEMGVVDSFVLEDGNVLEIDDAGARQTESITSGRVFVDGKGVGDVGDVVLRDRRHLSDGGLVLAILAVNQHSGEIISGPDLISRGFVFDDDSQPYFERAKEAVLEALAALTPESRTVPAEVKEEMRKTLRRYFKKTLERRPVILPVVMEF